jgi:hypothetical protein
LRRGPERADAELRQHGKAAGVELQLLRDGELLYGRRYMTPGDGARRKLKP